MKPPTASRMSDRRLASSGAEPALPWTAARPAEVGSLSPGTLDEEPNPLAEWISDPGWPPATSTGGRVAEPARGVRSEREPLDALEIVADAPEPPEEPAPVDPPVPPPVAPVPPPVAPVEPVEPPVPPVEPPAPPAPALVGWCGAASWRAVSSGIE
jgi:hypothetical protein